MRNRADSAIALPASVRIVPPTDPRLAVSLPRYDNGHKPTGLATIHLMDTTLRLYTLGHAVNRENDRPRESAVFILAGDACHCVLHVGHRPRRVWFKRPAPSSGTLYAIVIRVHRVACLGLPRAALMGKAACEGNCPARPNWRHRCDAVDTCAIIRPGDNRDR